MLLVLPQLWFGFYNGFSSSNMFDPWLSQLYNVLYTSFPIVLYAVFDEQFSPSVSIQNPQYYTPGIANQNFNVRESLKWFISPTIQSAFLCFVTFNLF
jgi:phospholipid-transporting ATPase